MSTTTVARLIAAPLCALAAGLMSHAAIASPDCGAPQRLTSLEQRAVDAASRGTTALRQFVQSVSVVYQLNVHDTMEAAMKHHQWRSLCARAKPDAAGRTEMAKAE